MDGITNISNATNGFWDTVFAHLPLYIGYGFAFVAAIAFLVFLRGLLSGFPHFFTLSSHDEHQHHHRVRVTWGLMMMIFIFIAWEVVRWLMDGLVGIFG